MPARLATLINELTEQNAPPSLTTCLRIAKAAQDEIVALHHRLNAIDPATRALVAFRPLAEVEREHIEGVVRQVENVAEAAKILGIGPATLYRRLKRWREEAVGIEAAAPGK